MIKITYSNNEVHEYPTANIAKFMILNQLFSSQGLIHPVEAVDVFGVTTGGVFVERPLKIRLGVVEFE